MSNSVRTRILGGLGAGAYGTLVAAVVQLGSVPILLQAWGPKLYGQWLVLFAVPAYLSLSNLGYSLSVANDMTTRVARGDREGALTAFQSLTALVAVTGTLAFTVAVGCVFLLPVPMWLHVSQLSASQTRLVLLFLTAEVLAQLLGGIASAGYRANGDFGLGTALDGTTILVQYVALWAVAGAGLGLADAAAAYFAARAVGTFVSFGYLLRRHNWLHLNPRGVKVHYLRVFIAPSLASLLLPLSNALKNQGLVLVVNAVLGPVAVVTFSVLRTLSRVPMRLVAVIGSAIEPEVAVAEGAHDRLVQQRLYQHGLQAGLWVSITAGAMLYLLGAGILHLWTRGAIGMNHGLFLWLLGSSAVAALWQIPLSVMQSLNRHLSASLAHVGAASAAVVSAWLLLRLTGALSEAGLAMLLSDSLLAALIMYYSVRLLGIRYLTTLVQLADPRPAVGVIARARKASTWWSG